MSSSNTVPYGVDFVYRVKSEYPFIVASNTVVVIGSRLTTP